LRGSAAGGLINGDIDFHWIGVGEQFYFKRRSGAQTEYLLGESESGKLSPLFDRGRMAAAIAKVLERPVSSTDLPILHVRLSTRGRFQIELKEKRLECDRVLSDCAVLDDSTQNDVLNPAGDIGLFSLNHNLWSRDERTGRTIQLTRDGTADWSYGELPGTSLLHITKLRAQEDVPPVALWSPDGLRFVSYRLDERDVPKLSLMQYVPEDGSIRPKVYQYHYDLVGDPKPQAALFIFDPKAQRKLPLLHPAFPSSFTSPMSQGQVWWEGANTLYIVESLRTEPVVRLLRVHADTGKVEKVLEEKSSATYFPGSWYYGPANVRVLSNGDIVWFSERSGWGQLYLYDRLGRLKHPITRGDWLVRDLQTVDEAAGYVYFSGSGRELGQDIYNRKLYRAKLDGSQVKLLTPEAGDHEFPAIPPPGALAASPPAMGQVSPPTPRISPNGKYFLDHLGSVQAPGAWWLRRTDAGSKIATLADEGASFLPSYATPEPFEAETSDGDFKIYGVLLKPADFDAAKKYPIIDVIFGGPSTIQTPKRFEGAIFGLPEALANLGFVVVMVDGRGTPLRSKAFQDFSYGHLETAGMLSDHVNAIRQLAQTRDWMDTERVGITGVSGGGFATVRAMVDYPDFFKVGVAGAGNYELRLYWGMWGEIWQGPPGRVDYDKVFPGNAAARLKGKLLIAHGDMDDNVSPAQIFRLADSLIKANKQFDMLLLPNVNHLIGDNPYYQRRVELYFLKNLMGAQFADGADMVPALDASPK